MRGEPGLRDPDIRNRRTDDMIGRATDEVVRDTPDDTARIRSEIARTRDDMSETIDAIQDRLSPRNLAAQARESVKEATVGKVRQAASTVSETASNVAEQTRDVAANVAGSVRRNPWPAVLISAGTAWMLIERMRQNDGTPRVARVQREYRDDGTAGYYEVRGSRGIRPVMDSARSGMSRASSQMQRLMRRNPLVVGALAAAVGVAVGLALPETERENRLMGETRDNLIERAQDAAQGAVDKVKQVAGEAADKL